MNGLHMIRVRVWRFLTSVKVGVVLLCLLAIASTAGTFIESAHDTATAQRLVYHSLWFVALMALLVLNIAATTWTSLKTALSLPGTRPILSDPAHFQGLPETREVSGEISLENAREALGRRVGEVTGNSPGLFAQRGILQRWGAIITHVGIILLLGGSLYLSLRAHIVGPPGGQMVWIGEGMERNWYLGPDPENERLSRRQELPFTIRLHDFDADYFPNTEIPRAFISTIELTTPDGHRSFHRVNMREALRWQGWKFSQSSFSILDESTSENMRRFFSSLDRGAFSRLWDSGRMAVRLTDTRTNRPLPVFDAGLGAVVPIPQSDLYFETLDGRSFRVIRGSDVVSEGTIGGGHSHVTLDAETRWQVRVDAFYPSYRRAETGHDSGGPALANPALTWTLLADGEPMGSDLAFHTPAFRGMRFADLLIQVAFESYEPADLAEWHEGDDIHFHLRLADSGGADLGSVALSVGDLHEVVVPDDGAAHGADPPALGPHTAEIVGRMPAAYSGLSVMKESMGLKVFFYICFTLFLLGPLQAFMMAHCQVWVWVDPKGGRALLGGRARGRRHRLTQILDRLESDLTKENT